MINGKSKSLYFAACGSLVVQQRFLVAFMLSLAGLLRAYGLSNAI